MMSGEMFCFWKEEVKLWVSEKNISNEEDLLWLVSYF